MEELRAEFAGALKVELLNIGMDYKACKITQAEALKRIQQVRKRREAGRAEFEGAIAQQAMMIPFDGGSASLELV